MRVVFITPEEGAYGFRLAGVMHKKVEDSELEDILINMLQDPVNGIVVVDERLLSHLSDEKLRDIERRGKAILSILPSPERPVTELEDYMIRYIRGILGYHVRVGR